MSEYTLVQNCTRDDIVALSKLHIAQYWDHAWFKATWQNLPLEKVEESALVGFRFNIGEHPWATRHQKVIHNPTGEIVGYARWYLRTENSMEDDSTFWAEAASPIMSEREHAQDGKALDGVPKLWDNDLWQALKKPIVELYDQYAPPMPYIRLDLLSISHKHDTEEIAQLLLESGIKAANRYGFPIFTRATECGLAKEAYKKLDFELKASTSQNLKEEWGVDDTFTADILVKHPVQQGPSGIA